MSEPQDMNQRFGALRSALHSLRGLARWEVLTSELYDWPQAHLEQVALPYLLDLLGEDEDLRPSPPHWVELDGDQLRVHPAWILVNALDLTERGLSVERAQTLARSPHLKRLRALNLSLNGLKDSGLSAIAQSAYLTNLHTLTLTHNDIGPQGIEALVDAADMGASLPKLRDLQLAFNPIRSSGLERLAQSRSMGKLTTLNLSHTALDDDGIIALTQSNYMVNLTSLELSGNGLSYTSGQALEGWRGLRALRTLDLPESISHNMRERLMSLIAATTPS